MQLVLTYIIEIVIFAFVMIMAFDFTVGLIILWQRVAPPTKELLFDPNNSYNFDRIDHDRILVLVEQSVRRLLFNRF